MKKKSIMIDMDDVIVSDGLLPIINEFLGTNYKESDFKGFYMQDIIPNRAEFFEFFFTKNQYEYCKLNDNVTEVLKKLCDKYDVYIGTSYLFKDDLKKCGNILLQKYNYLMEKFPFISPFNYVFLGNKSILNCDIKIDDNPNNLTNAKTKILYTAWHNKDLTDEYLKENKITRVNNWNEIEKLLLK